MKSQLFNLNVNIRIGNNFPESGSQEQVPDACKESEIIPFDSIRMYAYETPRGETPLCDRNLINETKWYRATDDMVTNATRADICGTSFPMWLSGIYLMHTLMNKYARWIHKSNRYAR